MRSRGQREDATRATQKGRGRGGSRYLEGGRLDGGLGPQVGGEEGVGALEGVVGGLRIVYKHKGNENNREKG